jgi:hypothetical protein
MVTGALLIIAAEQAFAHSLQIGFPNTELAQDVLYPSSMVLALAGIGLLVWGLLAGEFSGRHRGRIDKNEAPE